jgi:2TM domain
MTHGLHSAVAATQRGVKAMDDQLRLRDAKRQVARLKGFYVHATIFALVLLGLLGLNVWIGQPYWVQWVFLGWGIGLTGHAVAVFGQRVNFTANWEARKLKELMNEKPNKT